MLLDWPAQKQELQDELERAIRRQTLANAPVVARVPHVTLQEGRKLVFVHPDGSRKEMELEAHEVSWECKRDELIRGAGKQVPEAIQTLGGAMARDMETALLERLREASEKSGAVFRGETAQDLAAESLRALKSMDIEFDDDGRPELLMVASPQMMDRLAELKAPELRKQVDSILEKKRDEWLRRESRRRLAD